MKLIRESVENVKYLTEKMEDGRKKLYIEGTFLVGDAVNKNNRMYKMDTLRNEVNRYTEEFINTNRALGELGHPDTPSINLERVSHKIVSLKEDGNTYYGKALILETPYGQIVKNFIDNDIQVGVSSRALGSLVQTKEGYNLVQDDLKLATAADIVADPSAPGAFVNGIMENKLQQTFLLKVRNPLQASQCIKCPPKSLMWADQHQRIISRTMTLLNWIPPRRLIVLQLLRMPLLSK